MSDGGRFEGVGCGTREFFGALQGCSKSLDFDFAGSELSGGLADFAGSGVAGDHAAEGAGGGLLGLCVRSRTPYWWARRLRHAPHAPASLLAQTQLMLPEAVAQARDQDLTWDQIGQLLGLIGQVAACHRQNQPGGASMPSRYLRNVHGLLDHVHGARGIAPRSLRAGRIITRITPMSGRPLITTRSGNLSRFARDPDSRHYAAAMPTMRLQARELGGPGGCSMGARPTLGAPQPNCSDESSESWLPLMRRPQSPRTS